MSCSSEPTDFALILIQLYLTSSSFSTLFNQWTCVLWAEAISDKTCQCHYGSNTFSSVIKVLIRATSYFIKARAKWCDCILFLFRIFMSMSAESVNFSTSLFRKTWSLKLPTNVPLVKWKKILTNFPSRTSIPNHLFYARVKLEIGGIISVQSSVRNLTRYSCLNWKAVDWVLILEHLTIEDLVAAYVVEGSSYH